jgi:pyruvate dehydrogenase E2 component (dihydrolipoamide acetyltransferase)
MYGIDQFTAIINPPDACILAVGAATETVLVENGQMVVGKTVVGVRVVTNNPR